MTRDSVLSLIDTSMNKKRIQQVIDAVERGGGLKVLSYEEGGKHLRLLVRDLSDGVETIVITAKTPSDARAFMNIRSSARKAITKQREKGRKP